MYCYTNHYNFQGFFFFFSFLGTPCFIISLEVIALLLTCLFVICKPATALYPDYVISLQSSRGHRWSVIWPTDIIWLDQLHGHLLLLQFSPSWPGFNQKAFFFVLGLTKTVTLKTKQKISPLCQQEFPFSWCHFFLVTLILPLALSSCGFYLVWNIFCIWFSNKRTATICICPNCSQCLFFSNSLFLM